MGYFHAFRLSIKRAASLQLSTLLRALDAEESIQLMLYTARQGTRYAQGAVPRKGNRPKGKRRTQLHILQGLPNIGSEKARALLDTFGSVEAVLTANEDALQ